MIFNLFNVKYGLGKTFTMLHRIQPTEWKRSMQK